MSTIQEIMSRDPHEMTTADMKVLIQTYRDRRGQYLLGNMTAGSTKNVTAKEKEASKIVGKLDLSKELGL